MTEGYYWAKSALDQRVVVVEKDTDGTHYFIPGNKFPYNESHFEWISNEAIIPIEKSESKREPKLHHIEVFKKDFKEIRNGRETDIRFNRNKFKVNDTIDYMERNQTEAYGDFTGNTCLAVVVSVLENQLGIEGNYCVLGIKLIL